MILPIVGSLPSEIRIARALGLYDTIYGMWIMNIAFVGMEKHYTGSIVSDKTFGFVIGGDQSGVIENLFVQGVNYATGTATGLSGHNTTQMVNVVVIVDMPNAAAKFGLGNRNYYQSANNPIKNVYAIVDGAASCYFAGNAAGVLYQNIAEYRNADFADIFDSEMWDKETFGMPMFAGTAKYLQTTAPKFAEDTIEVLPGDKIQLQLKDVYPFVFYEVTDNENVAVDGNGWISVGADATGTATVKVVSIFDETVFDTLTISIKSFVDHGNSGVLAYLDRTGNRSTFDLEASGAAVDGTKITSVILNGVALGVENYTILDNTIVFDESALWVGEGDVNLDILCSSTTHRFTVNISDRALSTADDVKQFFIDFAEGTVDPAVYVVLTGNIDMAGMSEGYDSWKVPVNTVHFSGTFDGRGYCIDHLKVSDSSVFHYTEADAVIKNIGFTNLDKENGASTQEYLGLLISDTHLGTIENVFVQGVNRLTGWAGGLVNKNNGKIKNTIVFAEFAAAGKFALGQTNYNTKAADLENCWVVSSNASKCWRQGAGANLGTLFSSVTDFFDFIKTTYAETLPDICTGWKYEAETGLYFFGQLVAGIN